MKTKEQKCKHCGKGKGVHKAQSLHCPVGMRTRVGYVQFHNRYTFEEDKRSPGLCFGTGDIDPFDL